MDEKLNIQNSDAEIQSRKNWEVLIIQGKYSGNLYRPKHPTLWVDDNENGFVHDFHSKDGCDIDCRIRVIKRLTDNTEWKVDEIAIWNSSVVVIRSFELDKGYNAWPMCRINTSARVSLCSLQKNPLNNS